LHPSSSYRLPSRPGHQWPAPRRPDTHDSKRCTPTLAASWSSTCTSPWRCPLRTADTGDVRTLRRKGREVRLARDLIEQSPHRIRVEELEAEVRTAVACRGHHRDAHRADLHELDVHTIEAIRVRRHADLSLLLHVGLAVGKGGVQRDDALAQEIAGIDTILEPVPLASRAPHPRLSPRSNLHTVRHQKHGVLDCIDITERTTTGRLRVASRSM
jgi:hypothetical protein